MGEISSKNQNRIVWVDCMRALLIICMVCGHTGSPYNTYIYMMHMPGFLVLSGFTSYLACTKKSYRPAEYIKKRILSILIPAILVNTVFYLFYWMMEKLNLYTFVQAEPYRPLGESLLSFVKNLRTTDVGGGTWFLFVLFEAEVLFTVFSAISTRLQHKKLVYVLCAVCGLAGERLAVSANYLPYLLDLGMLAVLYYGIGYFIAEFDILNKIERKTLLPLCAVLTVFFGSFWFKGRLLMNWPTRQFADLFIQLVSCFACLYLVYELSVFLSKRRCSALLSEVGRKTYCILVLHFLVFKIVFLFCHWIKPGIIPIDYLQNLTPDSSLNQNGGWLIIAIVTIVICMMISYMASFWKPFNYVFNARLDIKRKGKQG